MMRRQFSERPDDFEVDEWNPLAQGLNFAGCSRYANSTLYYDSSKYGWHGTLTNMDPMTDWAWVPELQRFGIDFDGSNDYVTSPMTWATGQPITVSYWLNASSGSTSTFTIGGDFTQRCQAHMPLSGAYYWDYGYGFGNRVTGTYNTYDVWRHATLVSTGDANVLSAVYLDGKLDQSRNDSSAPTALTTLQIGAWVAAGVYVNGSIADFCVWNRVLSVQEIANLADPSNVMLSGLLKYRRKLWSFASSATAASPLYWMRGSKRDVGSRLSGIIGQRRNTLIGR